MKSKVCILLFIINVLFVLVRLSTAEKEPVEDEVIKTDSSSQLPKVSV